MAMFFMVIGVLVMLGSGGCSLLVLSEGLGGDILQVVTLIGGIPFLLGLVVFLVAGALHTK